MRQINIANDIIPIGKFKVNASKYLKTMKSTGRPMVITQNGEPTGVIITPKDFDDIVYKQAFMDSIKKGLDDIKNGKTLTTKELKESLANRRKI